MGFLMNPQHPWACAHAGVRIVATTSAASRLAWMTTSPSRFGRRNCARRSRALLISITLLRSSSAFTSLGTAGAWLLGLLDPTLRAPSPPGLGGHGFVEKRDPGGENAMTVQDGIG